MADNDSRTEGERFSPGVPAPAAAFPLKGCGALDWGMQSRLARVFRPATSRTVMLAIDHGYFQGPTTGLERVDLSIVPLLPWADALMTTRGMIRSTIPPASRVPVVLRLVLERTTSLHRCKETPSYALQVVRLAANPAVPTRSAPELPRAQNIQPRVDPLQPVPPSDRSAMRGAPFAGA